MLHYFLKSGYDIRNVQELLSHSDVKTTMICTHVLNRGPPGVRSPVDGLWKEGFLPARITCRDKWLGSGKPLQQRALSCLRKEIRRQSCRGRKQELRILRQRK